MKKNIFSLLMFACLLSACKKTDSSSSSSSAPDPNGTWKVTLASGHCLSPAASKLITVAGGQFSATILNFTQSGCTESLSVQGTLTMGNINFVVSGNETMSGSCCNGVNGFFSYIDPTKKPISGTFSSNWGTMTFEKQ